jgi:hypothetical protein
MNVIALVRVVFEHRFGNPMQRPLIAILCIASMLFAGGALTAIAQDGSRDAALILRILSYDRNIRERSSGDRAVVLVVYQPGNSASEAERARIIAALNRMAEHTTVANMQAGAIEHAFRDRNALAAAARTAHASALYVCSGLSASTSEISEVAREVRALSMTSDRDGARRGLGVGLVADGSQVRLVVNLSAANAEGARLDAALLRLAEIIR